MEQSPTAPADGVTPPPPTHAKIPPSPVGPAIGGRGLPPQIANLLGQLEEEGLVNPGATAEFVEKATEQLPQLTNKDRVLDALVHHGFITKYQRMRIEGGTTFGMVFGNYRVLERIGGGSIGVVFRAEHLTLRKKVAIKVLPMDEGTSPETLARYRAEAEMLAKLSHPHVINVHDAGTLVAPGNGSSGLLYMVMDLIVGKDLENLVYERGQLPLPFAAAIFRQLATGLAAAHAIGLIHRDLKPSNVLLTEHNRAKLIDFGLARHFGSTLTARPVILGSIEFMAPEQTLDASLAGPPADVYGLAATMYWVLTGHLPFPTTTKVQEALENIRNLPPQKLRQYRDGLPEQLEVLLTKMFRKNPAERPTAWEVAQQLERFADPTVVPGYDDIATRPDPSDPGALRFAISHLEDMIRSMKNQVEIAGHALLKAFSQIALTRGETIYQQVRMQEYCRLLLKTLKKHPRWIQFQDPAAIEEVALASTARNVGMVSVPDQLALLGEGRNEREQQVIESHTIAGAELLNAVGQLYGSAMPCLRTARAIIRNHHERWNGTGYPDKLSKDQIAPAARIVAFCDAYEDLRKYIGEQPGLSHVQSVTILTGELAPNFDPLILETFRVVNLEFERIFRESNDRKVPELAPPPAPRR
ncbi:MAG: protein kinase domain-containing protein [Gemmataceae bacterium]